MTSWLDRADHTADDFEDFAVAAEGTANERAAWETSRDERAARSALRPRTGLVDAAPIAPPLPRTNRNVKTPAPLTRPGVATDSR